MCKQVFVHFCTWFKTLERSGKWEMWNSEYPQNPHNPDIILYNGKRDIAATDYPLMGVYDSGDNYVIETQMKLIKACGIDGIIVDWDGTELNPYRHETFLKLIPYLIKHNLKLIICFEEWCGYYPKGLVKTRKSELNNIIDQLNWLSQNILCENFYARINGKKPLLAFRKIPKKLLSASEWEYVKAACDSDISYLFEDCRDDSFKSAADGWFFWTGGFDKYNSSSLSYNLKRLDTFIQKCRENDPQKIILPGIRPGFDDTPVWGWGQYPRIAPRYDGNRYIKLWKRVLDGFDAVQILTWNDWNEGSQIEPSEKYGVKYLSLTKKYISKFKNINSDNTNFIRLLKK